MKIAIIGTGAVGGYFGGKMVQAGYDVSFLARGEHLIALQKNGLIVKSIKEDFKISKISATNNIKEIGKVDLIILGVKAWQISEVANDLQALIKDETAILPLQNGVLASEELGESINKKHILGGLCRIISMIEAPGVINHIGVEPTIVFGELNHQQTERLTKIKDIFDKSGIESKISEDIQSDLWKKFIAICVSGLLAVSKTTYGELREVKETRQLMIDLLTEIYTLSQKIGINIESDFVDKTVSFIDSFPYGSTSSLTRDVLEGKPSEIEYQNGTVVRLGLKYEVGTPINRFVYNIILPMELKARQKN